MEAEAALVEITVNGQQRQIPSDQSVAAVLSWLELPSDRVAVELNRRIVRKPDWERTVVPAASQIEVVEFVGGC